MEEKQKILRAANRGEVEVLREIQDRCRLDWNQCIYDKTGDSALHVASRAGYPLFLKYLHEEGGMSLEQANFDGKRPLHDAAQFSQFKCVEYLISQGVEIDPMKRADWTPLMLACTKQDDAIVKFLAEHGASPRLRNKDGWNSFHLACREGNTSIVSYLLNQDPTLLESRSKNGRTPLHTAALHGHLEIVKLLTERSENDTQDMKDTCGTTALMDAIRAGHVSIARYLVDAKVSSFECRDGLGRTPIHLAAQAGCIPSIDFLLDECHMEVNSPASDLSRPLHLAAREGHAIAVQHLLEREADDSLKDSHGRTALMVAKDYDQLSCVQLLEKTRPNDSV
ncbi:ankyrin repeat domain-containing protein 16 isoform X2 [Daphnia magna]|nr:ankyrin repeat domain-containing protein 16 isoform X2 [Daphnia magna]XP_032777374.2 ankyrin repeat domain-containing protein 16 isoform X2 [Daphnia magna]XP_045026085.1 ankyrin repeat domain-containing protein 16 isoform X2 [Daphnia magna]XP_045026086.1 ankyrin repeat domain-containing protein 16 isoform X2 [Daphnia magna]